MPFQETITIINNSGKIISTGRHLVDILKGARATYKDRKDALKAARASAAPGIRRAQTFDVVTPRAAHAAAVEYYAEEQYHYYDEYASSERRRSYDDGRSHTSSHRSHRFKGSSRHRDDERSRPALTESNLKAHSEVSSTTPSHAPKTYRSPYAETAPRDMALSRPNLHPAAQSMEILQQPMEMAHYPPAPRPLVHRPKKEIDMDLAYGNIPPDLASRVDLEISPSPALDEEEQARTLLSRVEALLDEAHCIQHTASAIIAHLQGNPEAAAAVALTLAELSTLLGKLSPSFLGIVKGGSPAVFALLASPQFLIAAGVAVGVTIVMFGGWKIVKKIREEKREREAALAFEMQQSMGPETVYEPYPYQEDYRGPGGDFDEALVLDDDLDEELSSIESWRRGIQPSFGEEESIVDEELISPEADRRRREDEEIHPDDSASGIGSRHSRRTHKSKHKSSHRSGRRHEDEPTERKSSKRDEERSESGSHRSSKSSRSKRTEKVAVKAIEESKEKKPNMLKALFKKKKEKEDKERMVSVLV